MEPLLSFQAHSGEVGGVAWAGEGRIVTAGWDRTVRVWDAALGAEADGSAAVSIVCDKPCTGLACASNVGVASELLATSHSDGVVRVLDPRAGSGVATRLAGRKVWASGVSWRPGNAHHVAAAYHDGALSLWDLRAPAAALHQLHSHGEGVKNLCVAWDSPDVVCSGGEDRRVRCSAIGSE
jgi:WD40 repeat protein